ncbi:MAG: hypothetical protein COA65_02395 [Rhodospirillaceae bacterium]|nr:MAG: hypothetical protein COA65_02395 [Rhodospirillaceae bacterium]
MVDDIDIYRSANLLIKQHGEEAVIFAAMQADKCLEVADMDGKNTWVRVIAALEALQGKELPAGTMAH